VAKTAAGAEAGHAEHLAFAVAETTAETEARPTEQLASAVAETAAEAGARHAEQLVSAVVETAAEVEARQSRECATAVAKAVPDAVARAKAVAEARHAKQLEMVPAGRAAARPVTKLEVGEPPPGEPVVTGLDAESPARGGRPAGEQTQTLKAAHAAEPAVDLGKHLAEKERVAARESEALNREAASREERVAALEAEAGQARALHTQALGDLKVEHKVPWRRRREKQAALEKAKAVALAEADAKTAKAAERAAEEASAA